MAISYHQMAITQSNQPGKTSRRFGNTPPYQLEKHDVFSSVVVGTFLTSFPKNTPDLLHVLKQGVPFEIDFSKTTSQSLGHLVPLKLLVNVKETALFLFQIPSTQIPSAAKPQPFNFVVGMLLSKTPYGIQSVGLLRPAAEVKSYLEHLMEEAHKYSKENPLTAREAYEQYLDSLEVGKLERG